MKRTVAAIMFWATLAPSAYAAGPAAPPYKNIALGASYTMEPAPNYEHCTDDGDVTQLTDGKYTEGYFWTQPSTVGWLRKKLVLLTLDLGEVKPIRGVSFNTAAGQADVPWPLDIQILTAGEDKKFRAIGELISLDAKAGRTPPTEYGTHRYWTDQLRTHGRYVCLAVWGRKFAFVDEIEVYEGESGWVHEPPRGPPISIRGGDDFASQLARQLAIGAGIGRRLEQDIAGLRELVKAEGLSVNTQRDVVDELTAVEADLGQASMDFDDDFRAVLPLNTWHERVLRTQARLWRNKGLEPLTFWRSTLWDPLPLIGMPDTANDLAVEVHLMRKEYRAAAFNVSNSSDHAAEVSFRLSGLPGGDNPDYVTVQEVIWTDTAQGVPVAAALSELTAKKDQYSVTVPSGMTRQVWLTFHPVKVKPGTHVGEVVVTGGPRFPLRMHLYPFDFPEQRSLHLGGWDYTDAVGHFSMVTAQNRSLIVQHLRERFVDSPWAAPWTLPRGTHDAQGLMTSPPDTTRLDGWLELWPDAAQYLVFLKVGKHFGYSDPDSWPIDAPEFETAVKNWMTFLAEHLKSKGVEPEQLKLLLVDEPDEEPDRDHIILAWAKAIRAAETGIRVIENVNHRDMNLAMEEMIDACHILCPHFGIFLNTSNPRRPPGADEAYRDYFVNKREQGIELQFYSANGPARVLDPYAYYRLTAWTCWRYGAKAMYFWSLTDTSGVSSWNPYLASGRAYSPFFIDPDSVTAGKQLEALREGVADYELFVMLDRAIQEEVARGSTNPVVESARQLLENLPATVSEAKTRKDVTWMSPNDRTLADAARIQMLEALTALAGHEQ